MAVSLGLPFDGGKLREIRERAGLTRRALAARCEGNGHAVSQNHIWRLETNYSRPTPPLLKVLADTLGVELDALLTPPGASAVAS
jgi:transcriptional regulator with XRE-family HTH domain